MSAGASGPDALSRARAYLDADRPQEAIRLAGEHLAVHPEDPRALQVMASAEHELGRYSDAVRSAGQAIAGAPEWDAAWRVLALAHASLRNDVAAADAAERAVQLAPQQWRCHLVVAVVCRQRGAPDALRRALEAIGTAIRLAPDEATLHVQHGHTLLALGRRNEAVQAFQDALRLDPADIDARKALGQVGLARGQYDSASQTYAGVLREDPTDTSARHHFTLAVGRAAGAAVWVGPLTAMWVGVSMAPPVEGAPGLLALRPSVPVTIIAALVALAVLVVTALRVLRSGRVHNDTLWRDHRPLVLSWAASVLALMAALAMAALSVPAWAIELVVLPLAVAAVVAYSLGDARLEKRSRLGQPRTEMPYGRQMGPEWVRQGQVVELERQIALLDGALRRGARLGVPAALAFLVLVPVMMYLEPEQRGRLWVVFFSALGFLALVGVGIAFRVQQLRTLRRRLADLLEEQPT